MTISPKPQPLRSLTAPGSVVTEEAAWTLVALNLAFLPSLSSSPLLLFSLFSRRVLWSWLPCFPLPLVLAECELPILVGNEWLPHAWSWKWFHRMCYQVPRCSEWRSEESWKARSNGSLMERAMGWGEGPAQEVKRDGSINNSCLFRVCLVSGIYIWSSQRRSEIWSIILVLHVKKLRLRGVL